MAAGTQVTRELTRRELNEATLVFLDAMKAACDELYATLGPKLEVLDGDGKHTKRRGKLETV